MSDPRPVVVIPVYRLPLDADEEMSLRQVRQILGTHPRAFVAPAGLDIPNSFLLGENVIRFPGRYFTYPHGYNRLLMSARFYRAFADFTHMLIYQLDCLVFRDLLLDWCRKDYDYVGSPWYENYLYDYQRAEKWWVGNGGFSLRRSARAAKVLATKIRRGSHFPVPSVHLPQPAGLDWFATNLLRRVKAALSLWTVEDELANYGESEDRFWALDAQRFAPGYRIPPAVEAMGFGVEQFPEECFRLNGGDIPFGAHAWTKYNRPFIEKILASDDTRTTISGT